MAAVAGLAALWAAPAGAQAPGSIDVLAVLVEFPDRPLTHGREWFVGRPDALVERFLAYWAEVSSGRLALRVHVGAPVVRVPERRRRYVQRPRKLALHALEGFERLARTAEDRAALAASDLLLVFFAGTGQESHVGRGPHDPWSNFVPLGGVRHGLRSASVIAEDQVEPFSPFGVLCHEFGHQLGLPELYARGGATHEGIGVWGLMGQGTWIGRGEQPPHLSAWSKLRLGWVDVQTVEESTRRIRLPPVETTPRVVKVPVPGAPATEYYLLEHRRRIGADAGLPGEGLLIWHVDEARESFRGAQRDPAHKMVHLVEADGRNDLDLGHAAGGNRGDASDPWRGPSRLRRRAGTAALLLGALAVGAAALRLGCSASLRAIATRLGLGAVLLALAAWSLAAPVCGPRHPGMAPYADVPGRVVIRGLSPLDDEMSFDVVILPAPDAHPAGTRLVPVPDPG